MQKLLFLACLCTSFAIAQTTDTSCSPANQKVLKDIHHSAVLDDKFLPSLDDGRIRWLSVVVKFCKIDFFKTMTADKLPEHSQLLEIVVAMMDDDELSDMILTERHRRSCAEGTPISRFGF
jgi:hypothetical protein